MEMPSNCELRTRSVRKRTNNGCQSPSTPAHGDASQKDHAFRVGTFRCEAEPIANPGKLESIRFRSGHNRRAAQRGSDQACGLRHHNNTDLLGIEESQGGLQQRPKHHRLTVLLCLNADQAPPVRWRKLSRRLATSGSVLWQIRSSRAGWHFPIGGTPAWTPVRVDRPRIWLRNSQSALSLWERVLQLSDSR